MMTKSHFNSLKFAVWGAMCLMGVGVTQSVSALGYTVTQVGGLGYWGEDINNAGQVVGTIRDTGFTGTRGFIWDGATITLFGGLPVGLTRPEAINNSGQMAGVRSGTPTLATLWNGITPIALSTLSGYVDGYALGINDAGQVVGHSRNGCCSTAATLWSSGTAANLGTLGGSSATAYDINNFGQIVGMSHVTGDTANHATFWSGGTITDLGAERAVAINDAGQIVGQGRGGLGSGGATFWASSTSAPMDLGWGADANSTALDINKNGVVVGTAWQFSKTWVAFASNRQGMLWDSVNSVDLNTLLDVNTWNDWTVTEALAINDVGQILVRGQTFFLGEEDVGGDFTLVLTPCSDCKLVDAKLYIDRYRFVTGIPEPSTYALMLAGLGVLGIAARRRRH